VSLAHFVLFSKPAQLSNKVASALIASFSLWSVIDLLFNSSIGAAALSSWYIIFSLKVLSVPLCFHLVFTYIEVDKKEKSKNIPLIVYVLVPTAVVCTILIRDGISVSQMHDVKSFLTKDQFFNVSALISVLVLSSSLIILLLHLRKMSYVQNYKQLFFVFFGTFLLTVSVLLPVMADSIASVTLLIIVSIFQTASALSISVALLRYPLSLLGPRDAAEIIVKTMSDALVVVNMDRKIEIVNAALLQLLGYSEQELIGKRPEVIIGRFQSQDESVTRLLRSGVVTDVRTHLRKKSGSSIPVSLSWSVLRNRDQKIIGIVFVGRDMSERERIHAELEKASEELERRIEERTQELKTANDQLKTKIEEQVKFENQLHAEKEWLAVTLRSIGDGVITTDSKGIITLMNPAAEQLTGWMQDEAVGKHIDKVYVQGDHREEQDKPVVHTLTNLIDGNSNKPISSQCTILSKDGVTFTVVESASPIIDSNGERVGFVLALSDITERVLLEKEYFRARKLESITLLAGGIAHDFNNLLTSIVTNLFMAKMELSIESEVTHLITNAEKAAFQASNLAMQLLQFSKNTIPCKEKIAIREVIESSVGFYLSVSKSDYKLEFDEELWDIMIDRGQIDLVLNNMIGNADEAMPDGGMIIIGVRNVSLEQSLNLPLKKGKYIQISISDDGIGIDDKIIHKIFDPYFTTRENASGLGLTTAFAIVQKHGGHISVESVKGRGTTFTIYLPAIDDEITEDSTMVSTDQSGSLGIVLLLDDEEIVRESTKKVLNHLGYDVSLAENGDQALAILREYASRGIRLLTAILDLTVHGGKGAIDIIEEIHGVDPQLKVIVSSGYTNDKVIVECQSFGFHAAISKPYKVDSLAEVLRKLSPTDTF
jgi:PAS domain S-box-containing protein